MGTTSATSSCTEDSSSIVLCYIKQNLWILLSWSLRINRSFKTVGSQQIFDKGGRGSGVLTILSLSFASNSSFCFLLGLKTNLEKVRVTEILTIISNFKLLISTRDNFREGLHTEHYLLIKPCLDLLEIVEGLDTEDYL